MHIQTTDVNNLGMSYTCMMTITYTPQTYYCYVIDSYSTGPGFMGVNQPESEGIATVL